ncbi:MAG: hypothetical protein KKE36_15170 [Actinobacteria bacterium]|nr:hypothetical protein [Actinomycetota bacterium]
MVWSLLIISPTCRSATFLDFRRDGHGGFGDSSNTMLESMAAYSSGLWCTVGNWGGGSIWRVGPNGQMSKAGNLGSNDTGAPATQVFNGKLYAGTTNDINGASLWQVDVDGTVSKYKQLAANQWNVSAMADFSNNLWYGTLNKDGSSSIYRMDATGNTTKITDIPGAEVSSMVSSPGDMWVGTINPDGSSTVYRIDNTGKSTEVTTVPNSNVEAAANYDGDPWWGTNRDDGTADLVKFDRNGIEVQRVVIPQPNADIDTMFTSGDKLYVGMYSFENGGSVWAYDGTNITQASENGFGNKDNRSVSAIGANDGRLYAGTSNFATGAELWSAQLPPPDFYFAEGTTRPGFQPFIAILNQSATNPATVDIDFLKGDGTTQEYQMTVPAGARGTLNVADVLGVGDDAAHDFSTRIQSSEYTIAERPCYFTYKGQWSGGTDVIGATDPGYEFYFAEGTTRPGFQTYFAVANLGADTANVKATYYTGDGQTRTEEISIPPYSRGTMDVNATLGSADDAAHDFSTKIESTNGQPLLAERPEFFYYKNMWPGGSDVIGVPDPGYEFYFAEGTTRPGFDTYFAVANLGDEAAQVKATYYTGDGQTPTAEITVPPNSRGTINARDTLGSADDAAHDFSTKIESTNGRPVLAERPSYFLYNGLWPGGETVIGISSPDTSFKFAEGTTRDGFQTYFTVGNFDKAGEVATVRFRFRLGDGSVIERIIEVQPSSRQTVNANEILGPSVDFATRLTASRRKGRAR